jgi:hypothetical protein
MDNKCQNKRRARCDGSNKCKRAKELAMFRFEKKVLRQNRSIVSMGQTLNFP